MGNNRSDNPIYAYDAKRVMRNMPDDDPFGIGDALNFREVSKELGYEIPAPQRHSAPSNFLARDFSALANSARKPIALQIS